MTKIEAKDSTEIYYKDWGAGRPVVFSHVADPDESRFTEPKPVPSVFKLRETWPPRLKPKRVVIWYGDALLRRFLYLNDDVTSRLTNSPVLPLTAEGAGKALSRNIPRQFHAMDRTSSRTR
jgi:hypothetical protein